MLEFDWFALAAHRTQRNFLLTRSPVCYEKIKTQEQTVGKEAQGKGWGKGKKAPCPLQVHRSPRIYMCSPTQKRTEPHPSGFLWRLHHIGTIY